MIFLKGIFMSKEIYFGASIIYNVINKNIINESQG